MQLATPTQAHVVFFGFGALGDIMRPSNWTSSRDRVLRMDARSRSGEKRAIRGVASCQPVASPDGGSLAAGSKGEAGGAAPPSGSTSSIDLAVARIGSEAPNPPSSRTVSDIFPDHRTERVGEEVYRLEKRRSFRAFASSATATVPP